MDVEKIDISRFPLKHEVFTRKKELGEELARQRAAMRRAEAATVRRRKMAGWFCAALAVAAMIAAAIFMLQTVTVTTGSTGHRTTLPCGSTVQVEAYSRISYKPHLWNVAGRTVVLDGSACFDVEKGNSFTVETECGDISVLGTKFKVAEQERNLKVECFEGLVEVKPSVPQSGKVRLSAGEAVEIKSGNVEKSRFDDKHDITDDKLVQETINYNNEPLGNIVAEMEHCFGIKVINKDICSNVTYSGVFYPGDRDMTLEVVFLSCGMEYAVDDDVVTLKK